MGDAAEASLPVPVFVKDAAFTPPDLPSYYLLTADGLFLVRRTALFSASVPADGVVGLQPHATGLRLQIPPLPRALIERALGFFRAVYARWRGEGILIMFYAPALRRFVFRAPPQRLTGRYEYGRFRADLQLDYGACERPDAQYVKLGTFHSHGAAGPRHSHIDLHDELYETGLHITAGYVDSSLPEFCAAFVVGRTRFTLAPDDLVPTCRAVRRPPPSWLDQVTVTGATWDDGRRWGSAGARPSAGAVLATPSAGRRRDDDDRADDDRDDGNGSAR
jgi:hypothetical protein